MNRIFGTGKPKAPPPNLTDCIGTVSVFFVCFLCNCYEIFKDILFKWAKSKLDYFDPKLSMETIIF